MSANEVTQSIAQSTQMSGLLFQSHPAANGWKATRPGAYPGEVVAYKNEEATPEFRRLSLCFFEEGETDEDGYTYSEDTWVLEIDDAGEYNGYDERSFNSRDDAIERIAEIMMDVTKNRVE